MIPVQVGVYLDPCTQSSRALQMLMLPARLFPHLGAPVSRISSRYIRTKSAIKQQDLTYDYLPQIKGRVTPTRTVPPHIPRPGYALPGGSPPRTHPPAQIHDPIAVSRMRDICAKASDLLSYAGELVKPGVTTEEIDEKLHSAAIAANVYPSPLGYGGFPKSLCTSINEVVCHGIPDLDALIHSGDLVKLDVSCFLNGYHGDTCRTFIAGGAEATDEEGRRLFSITKQCLDDAIRICGPGVPISRIGDVIQGILDGAGFSAIKAYAGHGIGTHFHTRPLVWHFGANGATEVMRPGMTFTIEPMVASGGPGIELWSDSWTVVTSDASRCAQFEHTILITEHGAEVLTAYEK